MIQNRLNAKRKSLENAHKNATSKKNNDEDKGRFDAIGLNSKDFDDRNYLKDLRRNGSLGPWNNGQAFKMSEKDEIRGERILDEYVFNIIASNKVTIESFDKTHR